MNDLYSFSRPVVVDHLFNFFLGLKPDGSPWEYRFVLLAPGEKFALKRGSQHFGSGGYGASYRVWGRLTVHADEEWRDGCTSGTIITLSGDGPAIVVQRESDDVNEGRDWSFMALVVGEDEARDLEDLAASALVRMDDATLSARRFPTPRLCELQQAELRRRREIRLAVEQARRETREARRRERHNRRLAAALVKARRVAADEKTAHSIAHLFM
jgi:hypothetical protein